VVTWYQDISSRSRPASRDRGREPGWARFRVLEAEDGLQALSQLAGDIAADLVCPKPCEPQELMRVVRAVLDRDKAH